MDARQFLMGLSMGMAQTRTKSMQTERDREWEEKKTQLADKAKEQVWQKHFKQQEEAKLNKETRERDRTRKALEEAMARVEQTRPSVAVGSTPLPGLPSVPGIEARPPQLSPEDAYTQIASDIDVPTARLPAFEKRLMPKKEKVRTPTRHSELKRMYEAGQISEVEYKDALLKAGGTTVNIDLSKPSKSTRTDLEKKIVAAELSAAEMETIEGLFRPEFLTYSGRAKQKVLSVAAKAGVIDKSEFLTARGHWYREQKLHSLEIRKFITGVAGGKEEMETIMGALPDPDKDDPISYKAKFDRQRLIMQETIRMLKEFRAGHGFEPVPGQQRDFVKRIANDYDFNNMVKFDSMLGDAGAQ